MRRALGCALLALLFSTAFAGEASAQAVACSTFPGGLIDGDTGIAPPSRVEIDIDCTIRNFPASNPLSTNFSFFTQPGQTDDRYLVIFDNVVHTGNMSCNSTHEHKIWFTNGSSSKIRQNCQNLLIPVEKIDKANPAGTTTAAIGVPFTYTLTIPVLFDPATGGVIKSDGSVNELHSIIVTDDLNATGADLTYVSHTVTWLPGSSQSGPVPHSFTNSGGFLTWDFGALTIPIDDQFVIDLTVVLDDTTANVPGSTFVNTAKWQFGRLIDDVFYEPLPGENGITPPLTIAAPELVMTKTGPATLGLTLNLGEVGDFSLDVENTGLTDAWNVTIVDQLPNGATGGMCDFTPVITDVRIEDAGGATLRTLAETTDYTVNYAGDPTCELTLTTLSPASVIAAGEHLVIDYQAKLDGDSQDAATLTNYAGAVEWFNGDDTNPDRVGFDEVITNGTPGVDDHEDLHIVTVELDGYFFEKSVENVTTGVSPTTTASPGDTVRYTLRVQATQFPLDDLNVVDDLADLNTGLIYQPGSLNVISIPAGATDNSAPNGGANGEGIIDVSGIDVAAFSDVEIVFEIVIDGSVVDGTLATNQADLISSAVKIADSDDPNVNGQADPDVPGDEDPTVLLIADLPIGPLAKANSQLTATIGDTFTYQITIPETAYPNDIFDVRVTDDLAASAADLTFVSVTRISGGSGTPQNTGTATNLVIEDPANGLDIPAGEQMVLEITVRLEDTATNVAGLTFTNTAGFTYNVIEGDPLSERPGDPDTTEPMTIVEPDLVMTKTGPPQMTVGVSDRFTLDLQNTGDSPAYGVTISDQLPDGATGGMCDTTPTVFSAQIVDAGGAPVSALLTEPGDYTASALTPNAGGCLWTLTFTSAQTTIGVGERLLVLYDTGIDADTQDGVSLTNVGGATEWSSNPNAVSGRRIYDPVLTDGTPLIPDHEDPHSVGVDLPAYLFEKTVHDPTTGNPITTAEPGDVVRYRLTIENIGDPDFVDLDILDDLDALNAPPAFVPGTLVVVNDAGGTDQSDDTGGTQSTGLLDIRDLSLLTGAPPLVIEFDIQLATTLVDGTVVLNQSGLTINGVLPTNSDDPTQNGPADPFVDGDEDPTRLVIGVPPAGTLLKENGQATATIGESFTYQITIPETPFDFPMYDVRVLDDLAASGADLRFLGVTRISGGSGTPQNTGTDTNLVIEDPTNGLDIPAMDQMVLEVTVVLEDTSGNTAGATFANTADYTYDFAEGDPSSQLPGEPGTAPDMTIVEPNLVMTKSGPATMAIGTPETFTLELENVGGSPAHQVTVSDRFPNPTPGGMCDVAPTLLSAEVVDSGGATVAGPFLPTTDFTEVFAPDPTCLWTLRFTSPATTVGVGERLVVTYETELDVDTPPSIFLTNVAGATRWFSTDGTDPQTAGDRHTYIELLTNGTPGVADHEDAFVVSTGDPLYFFEKTVHDPTTGTRITTAMPGDTVRYRIRLENPIGGNTLSDLGFLDEIDAMNTPAAFVQGSLTPVTVPAGTDNIDPNGGANGTGLIDLREMTVTPGTELLLEFDITLLSVIPSGTVVTNQSQLLVNDVPFVPSDDPDVNGQAQPDVAGDEDPTRLVIASAPDFQVEKISTDLTGDPAVLFAGDTLRYTITVKNVGTDDATDAVLRDAIPANTTYVAGSTTLNGGAVTDVGGTSPLVAGMLIHAPENTTPGAMRADADALANNVATITFDVVVDPNVIDGTVISNQGFVSAPGSNVFDQPSDDPDTSVPDDPTRDIVGNVPLLFAPKTATLTDDVAGNGQVDPGDTLHYTITVYNQSATPATGVVLQDAVPTNTVYLDDTTFLNGIPVGQPDGGTSPLVAGFDISSSDLTPPLPGAGAGTLTPGESAVVEFDVVVAGTAAPGDIISNWATVITDELPDTRTDGDGNPDNGPEPTEVVVGDAQVLSITKQVSVVGGGPALTTQTLEYLVTVRNISTVPATGVVITDPVPDPELTYVAGSATMNGSPAGISFVDPLLTADYAGTYGDLPAGATITLRFQAVIDAAMGTSITNTATVTWDTGSEDASVTILVGGTPGVGAVSGNVWHDQDFDNLEGGATDLPMEGWTVELLRNGGPIQAVGTDVNGAYAFGGIPPNDISGDAYAVRFTAPGAGAGAASMGLTVSPFTDGQQLITDILLVSGSVEADLNLPVTPNGLVYQSVSRTPVSGATLQLRNGAGAALPGSCFADPNQQGQVTPPSGWYKFDLVFGASCPEGDYLIEVQVPTTGDYSDTVSQVIPPQSDATTPAFSVPTCPGVAGIDAITTTNEHCEVQDDPNVPADAAQTAGTNYHLHLTFTSATSGTNQIFNNPIPLDPVLGSLVSISKTTPQRNVSRGQLVPYEITVNNPLGTPIADLSILDIFPAGFTYVEGSAQVVGDRKVEPLRTGNQLFWANLGIDASERLVLQMLLAVGAGVTEGEFTNRVQAVSADQAFGYSGEAQATVRVVPDPTFDCTDVLGKVFDDENRNGTQERGERGLGNVRIATARGLLATTDAEGRFHITCAVVPREDRGSNFVLKLDDRTLPTGYRMTTRQTQVRRATRGKALRFSFGATIHRVIGLDLADAVFEPDTTEMRMQWEPRVDLLLDELAKQPAMLRLSYVADLEDEGLVERRVRTVKERIETAWKAREEAYALDIETEIFWRRGGPGAGNGNGAAASLLPSVDAGPPGLPSVDAGPPGLPSVDAGPPARTDDVRQGEAVERHLPIDEPRTTWAQDPESLDTQLGDRLEEREVTREEAVTIKLKDVVPPIRFASGDAHIPESTIAKLRDVLDGMGHLRNVRLHLIGHADDQALSPALARVYGDNEGLSRERAGEVAEFIQQRLALPPESISYSWVGDAEPIASNATEAGRAQNRRVEVEVWYDELEETTGIEEVVVAEEIQRIKVCRTETVCKLTFREGHNRRSRVKNLIPPLRYETEGVKVPEGFVRQVSETLHNLRDKQNVVVKFVGYTDDVPLSGRAERIYGNHLSLSKARAHRVALAVKDSLNLPTAAIASDGRGASRPVASNETDQGRALNRRVEVEFWHDDPLAELSDEPQLCPEDAGAEVVTKVYDPPWGRIAPLNINGGAIEFPEGFTDDLRRAMADVEGETNVRVRFVGYTGNEVLDRRTAVVYGDDIGLSAARARRAMEQTQETMSLREDQVEHEGRGYVHSNDVVNGGFIQGKSSYVVAQVVYDELAMLDDLEGVDIQRITRELEPKDPLALNLMRITVDGVPLDDPARSLADIQRCTDVALEDTAIQFHFDDLEWKPRLSVVASPIAVPSNGAGSEAAPAVRFRTYTNYAHWIERTEVRVFEREQSVDDEPVAVLEVAPDGDAAWRPEAEHFASPNREMKYVLRAYGADGRWDETSPQTLWIAHGDTSGPDWLDSLEPEPVGDPLDAGYGETGPLDRAIRLGSVGTVEVTGHGVPPEHTVWLAGKQVPVDADGNFAGEVLLPTGMHTVEVAVLDPAGNGQLYLRDLEFEKSDWFYMGIADVTYQTKLAGDREERLEGADAPYDPDSDFDGRLAYYVTGKFGDGWSLTSSADTREAPIEDLFDDFVDKSPDALFRRIDPDYHYPTFGDDGTVEETAPTQGKFYVRVDKDESHAMWGNFDVAYLENELAHVDRGLYGANVRYQSLATTDHGEQRLVLDGFAADPGTVPSREEFRGTGGSLYYLRRQDILTGSERLRVEVRDKVSGLVTAVVHLQPTIDYDIDYLQGRILLTEPMASTVEDQLLVRSQGLDGNQAWLVVQYEFTPGLDELDAWSTGGQAHAWLTDWARIGVTANRNEDDLTDEDSSLYAADVTLRASTRSWVKLQGGRSDGLVSTTLRSNDGGFLFSNTLAPTSLLDAEADALRADASVGFGDWIDGFHGRLSVYAQTLEEGYTAPGQTALTDTDQIGGELELPLTDRMRLLAKADQRIEDDGLETGAQEVDLAYQLTDQWNLSAGVRNDTREDDSPVVPITQEEGDRTDAVVQVGFDPGGRWRTYAFGQGTLRKTDEREANNRGGVGGAYRVTDRWAMEGEASGGNLGPAVRLGSTYQHDEHTQRYLSYALENERAYDGLHERRGALVSGVKTRMSDSSSVYLEDRYQHGEVGRGLARAMGVTLAPTDRWTLGANWELGTLIDGRTHAETDRRAGGVRVSYGFEDLHLSTGVEYRYDDTELTDGTWNDRTTWLFRNNARWQITPSTRLLGKANHSFSDSSQGEFFDGEYTEVVLGTAVRPVDHDRLHVLAKATYFYNMPTTDQVTGLSTSSQFVQRSYVGAVDTTYDITTFFSIGGKYAYRKGEVSLDRVNPDFFDNDAHLFIVRGDWRLFENWEGQGEFRVLELPDLDERKSGALFTIYRNLGDNFKVGVGYNFTDFSEDLTDLSYDHQGIFFNLVGTL